MIADLAMLQGDREERAIVVAATYNIQFAGLQSWVVEHPDEPERCYLVDMIERNCTCPDWHCTVQNIGIDCKHILAVVPLWEALTGLVDQITEQRLACAFVKGGRGTNDAGFVACIEPDPDDPYKD